MLSNTPIKSKLSINTTHLWYAYYAVYTQKLSSPTTNSVERLRLTPI